MIKKIAFGIVCMIMLMITIGSAMSYDGNESYHTDDGLSNLGIDDSFFCYTTTFTVDSTQPTYTVMELGMAIGTWTSANDIVKISIYEDNNSDDKADTLGQLDIWRVLKKDEFTLGNGVHNVDLNVSSRVLLDNVQYVLVICDVDGGRDSDFYFRMDNNGGGGITHRGNNGSWGVITEDLRFEVGWNEGDTTFPAPDTLNISNTFYPLNNTQYNVNPINLNGTLNSTYDFNVSLYINGTFNQSNNYAAGINVAFDFDVTFLEGDYYFFFSAYNETGLNQNHKNTTNHTFYIDITDLVISDDFVNNSIFYKKNLTGQFNFTDNLMIHSINITIDNNNVAHKWDLNVSFYSYNFTLNISNLSIGSHILKLRGADGHTSNSLGGDYNWRNGLFDDYLKFNFWDGGYVKLRAKEDSWFDRWIAERKTDRYSFSFEPANPSSTQTFIVEADSKIYIKEKRGYYGDRWLIIGDHWLDFVTPEEPTAKINFQRLSDTSIEVTISNLKNPTKQIYSSIGDLNVVTKEYTFFTTNATVTFSPIVAEKQIQTITLNISTPTGITSTNATLIYNGTSKFITKTSGLNYDFYASTFVTPDVSLVTTGVNFTWLYNIYSEGGSENGSIDNNQTVYQIGIDNCSTYTMRGINITVRRDDTNELWPSEISGYFQVWTNNIDNYRSFNLSWGNNTKRGGICIYPNESSYQIYSQFEYGGFGGFPTENHYLTNYTLNNKTQFLDFYLTPNSTLVTFTVTDQDDNVVPEVLIHILRYDFDTNSHITTEIIETDSAGESLGNIVLSTQWYKFLLVYQGNIVLETDPVKITSTSRNFRINLLTNFFDFFDEFDNVQTSLTFTNSTLNFAYTFLNTEGTSVTACLNVVDRSAINDILVEKSCVTSTSGTILINVGATVAGKTFIATGTIQVNPIEITDLLEVSFEEGYKQWGKDGIFIAFFVRLGLATIGIWSPPVAIILLILADIGMISMGLYHISWTIFIFYIILAAITMYKVNRKR